jgi:hypothetical protein
MENLITIVEEIKASDHLDPASPNAIFVHCSCMDFHGEKTTAFCSPTLKTFQKKK